MMIINPIINATNGPSIYEEQSLGFNKCRGLITIKKLHEHISKSKG
jgi:hypothetical protein